MEINKDSIFNSLLKKGNVTTIEDNKRYKFLTSETKKN